MSEYSQWSLITISILESIIAPIKWGDLVIKYIIASTEDRCSASANSYIDILSVPNNYISISNRVNPVLGNLGEPKSNQLFWIGNAYLGQPRRVNI